MGDIRMSKGESTRARALPRGGALRSGERRCRGVAGYGMARHGGASKGIRRGVRPSQKWSLSSGGAGISRVPLDPRRGYEARPPFPPSQVNNSNEGSNGPWGGAVET